MNAAERLIRAMMGLSAGMDLDGDRVDAFSDAGAPSPDAFAFYHPEVVHSLFGPTGRKETLVGRQAMADFVTACRSALADYRDEILLVRSIDEQCVFVHARAYRKSAASGEEISYEWAMLYRVEHGLVTYAADMLDADAQAFWGRVHSA
ncbi:nuclear transport factor 2 family protein [Novosphingobium malaysiense]|uniref:SnoaL-like domain-containing protein n=1 Tax=Novosphingobium malaysiense TaxID=1348853 RepID=A0A0B1ZF54_9SPHN|nr:nuclear transport factor 2 family protein [Novosphingobium malaysiense]KHK89100.1 hypothetical protein LK12_22485 [Novosphingobium malaysiense]